MKHAEQLIKYRPSPHWTRLAAAGLMVAALVGCGGGGGGGAPVVAPPANVPTVVAPTGTSPVMLANLSADQLAALTPVVTVGGVAINSPPVVTFAISDGATSNNPVIGFGSASTAAIPALTYLRFSMAKLVPGVNGNPSQWVNYIVTNTAGKAQRPNAEREGQIVDNKDGTYTYTFFTDVTKVKDQVAALASAMTGDEVAADLGDLTYDPALTHRLTIQLSGGGIVNSANTIYDFIPATGKAVAFERQVVSTDSCNVCHEKLTLHGARSETQYCVVCHTDQRKFGRPNVASTAGKFPALVEKAKVNPDTGITTYLYSKNTTTTSSSYHPTGIDPTYVADGEVSGNFTTLVHKIHQGKDLVKENYNYANVAFNNKGFPKLGGGQQMCITCHDNTKAAQADNWNMKPSQTACGACHDGINWTTGGGSTLADKAAASAVGAVMATSGHAPGQPLSNEACSICHKPADIKVYHQTVNQTKNNPTIDADLVSFTYEIKSAAVETNNDVTVVFKISANGVPLTTLKPTGFTGSPSFLLAWAEAQDGITLPADYNNVGNPKGETKSVSFTTAGHLTNVVFDSSSGYITATIPSAKGFPAAGKMRAVALQGYYTQTGVVLKASDGPENVARHAISVVKAVTGDTVRRTVVDSAKCANCHEWFEAHGGNRVLETQVCVMCHVPAKATSGRGILDTTFDKYVAAGLFSAADEKLLTEWGFNKAATNKALQFPVTSNNFKDMIHGIHAGRNRASPFLDARDRTSVNKDTGAVGGAITLLDLRRVDFPGKLNNCETCHLAGTYDSVPANGLASTYESINEAYASAATTTNAKASYATHNATDKVTSPYVAACISCHQSPFMVNEHIPGFTRAVAQGLRSVFTANVALGAAGAEPCAGCHGAGKVEDINVVHKK